MREWRPIKTAPKNGTPVDLWIVGNPDSVDFLTTFSALTPDRKSRHGRICDYRWVNDDWRIKAGLMPLMGLRMHDCVATHWMPPPEPPSSDPTRGNK